MTLTSSESIVTALTHYIRSRRVSGRPVVLKHNDVLSLKAEDVCLKMCRDSPQSVAGVVDNPTACSPIKSLAIVSQSLCGVGSSAEAPNGGCSAIFFT